MGQYGNLTMIDEYRFGIIVVDGCQYKEDVAIDCEGRVWEWHCMTRHIVSLDDIKYFLKGAPEIVIIGSGQNGECRVQENVQDFCQKSGIKLIVDRTEEAVKTFNVIKEDSLQEEGRQAKIAGFFHLTC